jgi:lipoprotein-releasing system permease protein
MLGICVGVAALITIISIMNGFEGELRSRLLSLASHATISAAPERMRDWQAVADRVRKMDRVVGVAPFLDLQGMVGHGQELRPALIRGVVPDIEPQVSAVDTHMQQGALADLNSTEQRIILGSGLAYILQAQVGDEVNMLVPMKTAAGAGMVAGIDVQPRIQNFIVSGIFEIGDPDFDGRLAFIDLQQAAAIAATDGAPQGLRLKFDDIFAAPAGARAIAQALGGEIVVSDWTIENASYFRAVGIEKTMMTLILMLIVAVAAFNIVAALVMVVNEKRTDIAILRTVGITPRAIIGVFITQGVIIGWFGALLGLTLGLTLAFNVGNIVPVLEQIMGVRIFDPTVYVITEVPSEVQWPQVIWITGTALVLTVLATVYPAIRGAATPPAEALRYE